MLLASQNQLGIDQWFAAHRWGASGRDAYLAAVDQTTTTPEDRKHLGDIANYQTAVNWIHSQLQAHPEFRDDDRKLYVQVSSV